MDIEARVLLERMSGNIELIKSSQQRQQEDMKRIEVRHDDNIKRIDDRLTGHATRLQAVEQSAVSRARFSDGERSGFGAAAKIAYTLGGGIGATVLALLAKGVHF